MFDPYYEWLGIPPEEQPPNHYRLLGIQLFEAKSNVIAAAADRQMIYLKQMVLGPHAELSQTLLNQVSAARNCLLDEEKRVPYNKTLRALLSGKQERQSDTTSPWPDGSDPEPQVGSATFFPTGSQDTPPVVVNPGSFPELSPPFPGVKKKRFLPELELWHYAVGIAAVALLVLGVFALIPGAAVLPESPGKVAVGSGREEGAKPDALSIEFPAIEAEQPVHEKPVEVAKGKEGDSEGSVESLLRGVRLTLSFEPRSRIATQEHVTLGEVIGTGENFTFAPGKVGDGLYLRHEAYIELNETLPVGPEPRSLSVWLRNLRGPVRHNVHVITQGANSRNHPFGIMEAGGKWRFYDNNGGLCSKLAVDQQWHHHCISYDGHALDYYIDGRCVGTAEKRLSTAYGPLVVGATTNKSNFFVGSIDELAYFDRPLSPDEVQALYDMGVRGQSVDSLSGK